MATRARSAGMIQSWTQEAEKIDAQRIALFAFIVVVISTVHAYLGIVRVFRPGVLLWLFVLVYPMLRPGAVRLDNLTSAWPAKVLLAFGAFAILSIPFGISMGQAGKYFIDIYSRVLLFALILIISIRGVRDMAFMVWAYVISIGTLALLAFTKMNVGAVRGGIQRLQGEHMYDSNDMGVLFNIALPLALLCLQTAKTRLAKLTALGVLVSIPAVVAMFGSRGAFVGAVSVGIALFFCANHVALFKRLMVIPVLAAALVVAAPEGYWDQMKTIINPGNDYNVTEADGRLAIMQRSIEYIVRYPVFGLGLSNFGRAEGTISSKARSTAYGTGLRWIAPHNTYVQVVTEMGVVALGLWLALIAGGVIGITRQRRRIPAHWARGTDNQRFLYYSAIYLPPAFVGFAVPSFFVSHAYTPQFYILVAYLVAFLAQLEVELRRQHVQAAPITPAPRWRASVMRAAPLIT